jgi:glycosyltransferase involved in cell wall biosynthesis
LTYPAWLRSAGPWLLRLPDAVTCVSDQVARHLVKRAPSVAPRCAVIANGIDLSRFQADGDPVAARRALGLPADAWVVGTVGSLRAQKNHALLLRAFAEVRRAVPSAWLAIVGGGELLPTLEALARTLEVESRVRFLGSRLDVPQLLPTFDAFCLTSDYEGMPLSVLEAMASGLAVVVTDVTGSRDVVAPGVTGLVCPPGDPAALGRALVGLAADRQLAARLGSRAREHVAATLGLPRMLARYGELYARLLARRGGRGRPARLR